MAAEIFVYSDKAGLAAELATLAKSMGGRANAIALSAAEAADLSDSDADKVYLLTGADPMPENNARAIADFLKERGASALLVGSTMRGRDLAAQVAGFARAALLADASDLALTDEGLTGKRMVYGGSLVQQETVPGFAVATVAAGSCEPGSGAAEMEEVSIAPAGRVKVVESKPAERSGVDLTAAKTVVAVGLGIDDEADLGMVREVAAQLDGGVGCTRSVAEDRGWFSTDEYIGISGLVLKPDLYLAVALSGALQHMFGVREAKTIAAVNTAKDAPIFQQADYGIVGDYKEIMPLLLKALKEEN
ncbi:electron transfer flavoprotein subunit alpha/FixB family protein [Adlercreutzia sp. R7]|uniref:Electron transfer flavoprotein subunit alpha/FixB family protein n=1 Tax=Adlercreutzia wanghongyangiae TaxID=3111451 RepID=A0ABU6IKG4_9ACTN|nr:electron transfer flavoprotein subunit alpha/FixB family protein [Adlercreutzia sp. R7]